MTVTGTVTDPSGAVVPNAAVSLVSTGLAARTEDRTLTGSTGGFTLRARPGSYQVVVEAPGFARFEGPRLRLDATPSPIANPVQIQLKLETQLQQIDVEDDIPAELRGGTSILLSSHDIQAMPLDSASLLDELQGLAGSKDAELVVDGFSGAKLPPRASIREVRINQNPFSAQNDTNPVNGVIQVSTRPGTDSLHGQFYLYGDDSALNASNPFAPGQPPYYAFGSGATLSGPLGHRASYFGSYDQMDDETDSPIDAQVLDANLNPAQLSYAVPSPRTSLDLNPRLDLRAGTNSIVAIRYLFDRQRQNNAGLGPLTLASQAYDSAATTQTLQLTETQTLTPRIVDETRLQLIRTRTSQSPASAAPALTVEGAFLGGGSPLGALSDHQDRLELQNYLSLALGAHYLNLGGRLRIARDANRSLAGFNGQFFFPSLAAYRATLQQQQAGATPAQVRASGGGASQFVLNAGTPDAAVTLADAGLFLQEDWKLRPNLTLSYGLRFETQTGIPDHADWAPRFGFSWGLGAKPNAPAAYTLRGGAGIFYRRFGTDSALTLQRQNGTLQQEYVVASPDFYPNVPAPSALPGTTSPTLYRLSPAFHAPYYIGASISLDRRLGRYGTASLTFLSNRGVHTQLTENVNAPLPGTYSPANPASGTRPLGTLQNVYEFVSAGVYRSNRLTATVLFHLGERLGLFGSYTLRFDKNDAELNGTFPSNQYNLGVDYARSLGDIRHTATLGGSAGLPYGIHTSAYLRALSGAPFNIVVGQDLNGDTQFNDRPAFATDLTRPSVVLTRFGAFDTSPIPGQTIIPRNYGQGPGQFLVNLTFGKSLAVGPVLQPAGNPAAKPAARTPAQRKYTLDLVVEAENLLNHPNLAPPVGTLGSPLFGRSTAVTGPSILSADRNLDLQLSLHF
jgi:hypothetical protein